MSEARHRFRKSLRLNGYDYRSAGCYFVTICTLDRRETLSSISETGVLLSAAGEIADACWRELPRRFPSILLDEFVVMPNHVHGIVILGAVVEDEAPRAINRAATRDDAFAQTATRAINRAATGDDTSAEATGDGTPIDSASGEKTIANTGDDDPVVARFIAPVASKPPTLGEVVRHFKGRSTHLVRSTGLRSFGWQPNYYEHIIRNDQSLEQIRNYILSNPSSWDSDEENPRRGQRSSL